MVDLISFWNALLKLLHPLKDMDGYLSFSAFAAYFDKGVTPIVIVRPLLQYLRNRNEYVRIESMFVMTEDNGCLWIYP